MSALEIARGQQRIDHLFKLAQDLPPEVSSHWGRYLCILTAGYLETSIRAVYVEYAQKRSHPSVARYVEKGLQSFQNPNMQRVADLARTFDPVWAERLELDDKLRDSVNSILANRHLIAHGRHSEITVGRLRPLFQDAVRLIELIREQCGV